MVKFSLDLVNQKYGKTLQVVGANLSAVYAPGPAELNTTNEPDILRAIYNLANMTAADVNQYFFYNKSDSMFQDVPAIENLGPNGYGIAALTWVYPNHALQANKSPSIIFGFWDRIPLRWYEHTICNPLLARCHNGKRNFMHEMVHTFLGTGDILHTGGSRTDLLVPRSGTCGGQLITFTQNPDFFSGPAYGIVFPMVSGAHHACIYE